MTTIDGFADYVNNELGLSYNTVNAYMYDVSQFLDFIGNKPISVIIIEAFIDHLRILALKNTSIRRKYMAIRCFCNHLISLGYLDVSIVKMLNSVRIDRSKPNVSHANDVDSLLSSLYYNQFTYRNINVRRNVAIVLTLYHSGLRVSELCSLKRQDINFVRNTILVHGKGGKDRVVPSTNKCIAAIKIYLETDRIDDCEILFVNGCNKKQMTRQGVSDMLLSLSRRAGISHTTAHKLRGGCATSLLNNGMELEMVMALLGHTRPETTQTYLATDTNKLISIHKQYHPTGEGYEATKRSM